MKNERKSNKKNRYTWKKEVSGRNSKTKIHHMLYLIKMQFYIRVIQKEKG